MKINEFQLRKIIKESVKNILQENDFYTDGAIPYQHKDTTNNDTYMKIANLVSAVYSTLELYKHKAELNPEIDKLMGNPRRGTTMVQSIEKAFQHLLEIKNVAETVLLGGKSNSAY